MKHSTNLNSTNSKIFKVKTVYSTKGIIKKYKKRKRTYEKRRNFLNKWSDELQRELRHSNKKDAANINEEIKVVSDRLGKETIEYRKVKAKLNQYEANDHPWQFYQFNAKITSQLFFLLADRPLALKILAVIMFCAWNKRWGAVLIKKEALRKAVATTKRAGNKNSVNKAIQYLRSLGIIAVSKLSTTNVYIINPNFIWQQPISRIYFKSRILKSPRHISFEAIPEYCRKEDNNGKCSQIVKKLEEVGKDKNSTPLTGSDLSKIKPEFTSASKPEYNIYKNKIRQVNNRVEPYYPAERNDDYNKRVKKSLKKEKDQESK